jgi:hypothetical protein
MTKEEQSTVLMHETGRAPLHGGDRELDAIGRDVWAAADLPTCC